MGLEIRLFGTPTVTVDGAPLNVDTRKAVALLARLAVAGPRIGRDVVATMLWPEAPQDRARASLRRTLSALTTGLGGRWVTADRSTVVLEGDGVECDVATFRALVQSVAAHDHPGDRACTDCRTSLTHAAALWTGDFLDGFALRDAPAFEDWALLEGEALRRQAGSVLERLTAQQVAIGALDDALATAHRWVAMDPLHEQAHRAVMRVAAWAGRRDEATRQFHECVAALDRELGVAPLPATADLHRAILDGDVPAPPTPLATVPPPPPTAPAGDVVPLVDRTNELARLLARIDERSTDAAMVTVEGEAGIGKTRLVQEVVDLATRRGHATLVVRCNEGESSLACGPIVDLLRAASRMDPAFVSRLSPAVAAEVGRVLPDLAGNEEPASGDLSTPGARARFLDAVGTAVVESVSGRLPGLVVLDDLHCADPTTVEVLGYLARRPAGRPVVVLCTWRTEAVPHDHAVRQLTRVADAEHVTLGRLGRDDVGELVDRVRPEVTAMTDRLFEETEGIPFFVVQYLMTWDGTSDWQLPGPVRDLLHTRLVGLSDLARQCLTAAAVVGRAFDVPTLVRVSGRSEDEVVTALDEALAQGLVREQDGFDFTHTKIRDVVYDVASLARRRLLHRRAAESLLRTQRDDLAAAASVARHLQEAGQDEAAAIEHARAAAHARSLFANEEALDHLLTALALGHPDPAALHRQVGDLHALSGLYADARASYDTAAALAGDDITRGLVEHRLGALCLRRGDWSGAVAHLGRAADLLRDATPDRRARIEADLALVALRRTEMDTATEHAERALEVAEESDDHVTIAQARNTAGLVARRRGDLAAARAHLDVALAVSADFVDPAPHVAALNNLALVSRSEGRAEEALEPLRRALHLAQAHGDRHHEAALHSNVADALHALGRTSEAVEHVKESARLLADIGEPATPEPEIWKLTDW